MMRLSEALGLWVKECREMHGWSKARLAYYADMPLAEVFLIEQGGVDPAFRSTWQKISGAFHYEPDVFLQWAERYRAEYTLEQVMPIVRAQRRLRKRRTS